MKLSNLKAAILAIVFMVLVSFSGQQNLTVTLTQEQWQEILTALDERPHKTARPIIDAILTQANKQLAPPPAPDTTGKKKEEPKTKKQ